MAISLPSVIQTNSTTYCDELGILVGINRLPGEQSDAYLRRLKLATRISRDQSYIGLLNEISLRLGLNLYRAISLESDTALIVNCNVGGIILNNGSVKKTVPLLQVDVDDAWTWFSLSQVVAAINDTGLATATLNIADASALMLSRQSNIITVVAQPIQDQQLNLGHTGIIQGSESFNIPVPQYTLDSDGTLIFQSALLDNTTITYQYFIWPYTLIAGDVALIGLLDPGMPAVAKGTNGSLVYQVREVVQNIMQNDLSYWSK